MTKWHRSIFRFAGGQARRKRILFIMSYPILERRITFRKTIRVIGWVEKYIGIGPSAHSYDGEKRSWNVSNNSLYLKSISENKLPSETEILSKTDRYNEYVMTGLRTIWGISLDRISSEFGKSYLDYLNQQAAKYIEDHLLFVDENILRTTKKGKFLSDGIASDLFLLNLE